MFTVYDNTDGGYTIIYKYWNYSSNEFTTKKYQAFNSKSMIAFTTNLQKNGYKFVGGI